MERFACWDYGEFCSRHKEDLEVEKIDDINDFAWNEAHYMLEKLERVLDIGNGVIARYKKKHDSLAPKSVLLNLSKEFEEKLDTVMKIVKRTKTQFMRNKCNILVICHCGFIRQGLKELYKVLINAFCKIDRRIYDELCLWEQKICEATIDRWSTWRRKNRVALRRHYKSALREFDIVYAALDDAKYFFNSFN
jgi:hypothetical protein